MNDVGPRLSLCVCTMNRPGDLRAALASVAACDPPPFEVFVSDDSPEADRRSEAVAGEFPGVRYGRGPRRGLSANRNACIAATSGDWVLFIDDDVTVPPGHFWDVAAAVARAGPRAVVSGWEDKRIERDGRVWRARIEPPGVGFWGLQDRPHNGRPDGVVMNAAAFPRSLFDAGAAFDERLRYGSEEIDACRQARRLGYGVVFDGSVGVRHDPASTNRDAYVQSRGASHLYATMKGHLVHRRAPLAFTAFALLGPPRLVARSLRRRGVRAGLLAVRQAGRSYAMLGDYLLHGNGPARVTTG